MCSDPQNRDGQFFACRICNECIAKRRTNWVARAMAEKATAKFTSSVTLTYSDDTQRSRDGAAMFQYHDVKEFLMRLRSAASYEAKVSKWGFKPSIRFLCAGEQGTRFGRCHWHIILYTNFDLHRIGKFRRSGKLVSHRRDIVSEGTKARRLNWSLWPHGFMSLQESDLAGMNYVLSYCLKDQFTVEKSKGTMREHKAEAFATGLFRMSKFPPIGTEFLMRKLERLHDLGAVLPSPKLQVPGLPHLYEPRGTYREALLWGLVALNKRHLWTMGANAPQWSSLVASVEPDSKDWNILHGLPQEDEDNPHHPDFQSFQSRIEKRSRETAHRQAVGQLASNCARALPCRGCLHSLDADALAAFDLRRTTDEEGTYQYQATGAEPFGSIARRPIGRINPYCLRKGSKIARLAAPTTGRQGPTIL